jgi:histidinol-phosphate phosphatase family protein
VLRHRPGWRPETILLDRDGTLVFDRVHLGDPDGVELLPGVLTGLRLLQQAGIRRVIVSNQSGIGRGLLSHGQVAAVHDRLKALLYDDGLTLDGIFYCPHSPEESCPCRKPQMGLAREASVQMGVDLARSVVVGDTDADVGLAEGLGVPSILVLTGSGPATLEAGQVQPHFAVTGLEEMARIILHPGGLGLPLE